MGIIFRVFKTNSKLSCKILFIIVSKTKIIL